MSSASSAVTYTSVYTDSEPGRAFWGADDEEPVAPPSPDYIPGPEDPQTPPVSGLLFLIAVCLIRQRIVSSGLSSSVAVY
ncbi:hypothetical protein Tco_0445397 [Tanacetum coccineum]